MGAEVQLRLRILDEVRRKPGIHLRDIARHLGASLGAVTHHVRSLEKAGSIIAVASGRYRHLFPSDLVLRAEATYLSDWDRRLLAECRRATSLGIVLSLVSDGSLTQWELRRRFGKSKSTISYYMSRLESAAIVHAYGGFGAKRYDLTNRRRTVLLLSAFAGSLRDHLEAFTDLWMSLVERTPIRHQNSEDIPRT